MEINNSGGNLLLGEEYSLTCVVTGADKLNPVLSYGWTQNGTRLEMIDNKTNVLSFSPFRRSGTGNYSCIVNIFSQYVNKLIVINSRTESIQVQCKPSIE